MEWRPVVGFEGSYEVSDTGLVRGVDRIDAAGRRWRGRVFSTLGCDKDGYIQQTLCRGTIRRSAKTHILVLEAFVGPRPEGAVARHLDGDHKNNSAGNLVWGSSSENGLDRVAHGVHNETRKTHCRRGHTLAPPNLVASRLPSRICLACARGRAYVHRARGSDLLTAANRYYAALTHSE